MRTKGNSFLLVLLLMAAFCLSGCATTAQETKSPFYQKASQVEIGMTQNQVTEIIGNPSNSYKKYTIDGMFETWTYTNEKPFWVFTFKNGVLTSRSH